MSEHKSINLSDYSKSDFSINKTYLEFDIHETHVTVLNRMKITRSKDSANMLSLNGEKLELLHVNVDGKAYDAFSVDENFLHVTIEAAAFELEVLTKIYPQNNLELEGLYKSNGIFCTQNEPEGFRKITYFLDRPDVLSLFETKIIADVERYPQLLSNGNLKEVGAVGDDRHYAIWDDPFYKPTYLFALVVADLGSVSDNFTTMSGREIELNIYVDKGNESKCIHAMNSLKNAMKWDEEVYGLEYDLDIYNIVAVDSFNMGAMENKGLNIFNSAYVLADTTTASDANYMGIESVIAHEYFHNYSGNRVTCRDWFQLTLKEGFTVFRDQSFSADMNSAVIQRIDDVSSLRERQFVEDASAMSHPIRPSSYIEINNFYTSTVYEKGAEVIRMYHTLLGSENFRKASDDYFARNDAKAVTCEDFFDSMQRFYDADLSQFMRWYAQERTPRLHVKTTHENGLYTLVCTQKLDKGVKGNDLEAFLYPLKIAIFDKKSKALLREETLVISKMQESFTFEGIDCESVLSLNREFSAPIIIEYDAYDYAFLMAHEYDGFARYEACEKFKKEVLFEYIETGIIDAGFIEAIGSVLADDCIDNMFKARLLEEASISTLMQEQDVIDVSPLYSARDALSHAVATQYAPVLETLYRDNNSLDDTSISAESMGKRAIKNRALRYLMCLDNEAHHLTCKRQFIEAKTMTDRIVALDLIENHIFAYADEARAIFYEQFKEDTLVMNKYFSIISANESAGTLDRVQAAQHDAVFDIKVPNLVRSLYGVFARNYKHFHAKNGHGYSFIADKIIELDSINPQIAAGLSSAFKSYARMNEENRAKMKVELERILALESLSNNVYEVVSKTLQN